LLQSVKVGSAQIAVRLLLRQDHIRDSQNCMTQRDESAFLAATGRYPPVLGTCPRIMW
jgi:hypothetical protein